MAKILITLLGTGKYAKGEMKNNRYETTDYILNGKIYKEQSFVSFPIIDYYNINRIYFIGTNQSMWDNIAEVFGADEEYIFDLIEKKEVDGIEENDLINLSTIIDKKLNGKGSRCYITKDGENEEELWAIFEKFLDILEDIEDEDIIYFDITHLFRSLSVMSFVIAEFGKTYKDFEIGGMFYGMLKKNEPSRIIDVGIFFELLEWAKAIEEIEKFASIKRFLKLSQKSINANAYNVLARVEEAFSIANMSAIYNNIKKLSTHLKYFKENDNKVVHLISLRLENFVKELDKSTLSEFQFALAEFFAKRNFFSIAYIALAEAVVSFICEKNNWNENREEDRKKAKEWIREGFNYHYTTSRNKFAKMYNKQIAKIRNNICHQLENSKQAHHDIENFELYLQKSKRYLKEFFP